jgi:hypothetical protein
MVLLQHAAHMAGMIDSREERGEPRVEWSEDFRVCTASALDARGKRFSLTFASADPVGCAVARARMETAAVAALGAVVEP